jgi:hypothetical protein
MLAPTASIMQQIKEMTGNTYPGIPIRLVSGFNKSVASESEGYGHAGQVVRWLQKER